MEVDKMIELEKLVTPYAVPNTIIRHRFTGKEIKFYAVSSDGKTILVGVENDTKDTNWIKGCWSISKEELLEDYRLC